MPRQTAHDKEIKKLFDMVYQWGRVGVVADPSAPAFVRQLAKVAGTK